MNSNPTFNRSLFVIASLLLVGSFPAMRGSQPVMAYQVPRVPTQFMAKMYTEGLGRVPEQAGWQAGANFFAQNGCNKNSLKTWGRGVYLSAEYNNTRYDNAARLLTLYRGVLNREPDRAGFDSNLARLNSGTPWAAVVDSFFDSAEFQTLIPLICGNAPGFDKFNYGFGKPGQPAISVPTSGTGFRGGTSQQLQQLIDATPAGGTVWLAQKALVEVTGPVNLKAGVTLSTTPAPSPSGYAMLGRLVRARNYVGPVIRMFPGAKLKAVWVDGARAQVTYNPASINVVMLGGAGSIVSDCKISDTAGFTGIRALGAGDADENPDARPCANMSIHHNLVTSYSSIHTNNMYADGISSSCENTLIQENQVVDATDVGIIIYEALPAIQASKVRNNVVLSAGNSAYGAYAADPLQGQTLRPDFTGSVVERNLLWTGPNTHFDIALAIGTRPWFAPNAALGRGASFTDNTTGTLNARAVSGIAVSGMLNAFVQRNVLTVTRVPDTQEVPCPSEFVWASVSAGFASGSIQPYKDVNVTSACMGH